MPANSSTHRRPDQTELYQLLIQNQSLLALYPFNEQLLHLRVQHAPPLTRSPTLMTGSGNGRQNHRLGEIREAFAVVPLRHLRPCRPSNHDGQARGLRRLYRAEVATGKGAWYRPPQTQNLRMSCCLSTCMS